MWTDCLASAGLFFSPSSFCGFSHLALMLLGFVRTSSHLLPSCLSSLARPPVRSPCWGVCRDMHLLFTFFVFLPFFVSHVIYYPHTYIHIYIHTCIPFRASLSIPVSPHPCIHISPRPSGLTSARAVLRPWPYSVLCTPTASASRFRSRFRTGPWTARLVCIWFRK